MQRIGARFARVTQRLLPEPMVIACGLTLLALALALICPTSEPLTALALGPRSVRVARMWFAGIWSPGFLVFALQMCVVLLTGYGLAQAPPARRALNRLADRASGARSGVALVGAVSCAGCWVNWGFGIIAAGVLATRVRESLAARRRPCHDALLVAAAYSGMMIWHGGLSGSAPLRVAKEGVEIMAADRGAAPDRLPAIDVRQTTLSTANLALSLVMLLGIPAVLVAMTPPAGRGAHVAARAPAPDTPPAPPDPAPSVGDRLNRARIIPLLIAAGLLAAIVYEIHAGGFSAVNLDFVNTLFLALGLLLHPNLGSYVAAVGQGGRAISGIVLQFPLYSGIQGIMFGSGLAASLSVGFVNLASSTAAWLNVDPSATFPVATFFSAGLVNLFVPSGGGQWIVQGPIMCSAALQLGTPIEQTILAVAYGDQWTNMIQPFWAIPLIGLTGVRADRFIGYCVLLMIVSTPLFLVALWLCGGG